MLLSILIPTYNRSHKLIDNIVCIEKYIIEDGLVDEIEILVSDNCSCETEKNNILSLIPKVKTKCHFYFQDENIGFENNLLFLLKNSKGTYSMTLGDDDFFDINLFRLIIKYLKTGDFKAIVCNFVLLNENNIVISEPRDIVENDKIYDKGDFRLASMGHQMSCLVFWTEGLYDEYIKKCRRNLYPQVFFVGYSLSLGKSVHITRYPYKCSFTNKKNFEYKFDNLFDELCVAFDCLPYSTLNNKISSIKYYIKRERDRYVNRTNFFRPVRFIHKVIRDYKISKIFKLLIIQNFVFESIKLPFVYLYNSFRENK